VALEAHGQNILLVFHSGRPEEVWYRDLGGVRVSPARLRACGIEPPPVHGDLASDDPQVLRRKVLAGALSTVVAQVVATLADSYGEEPAALWRTVAAALRAAAHPLSPGAACLMRSLFTGPWPIKATTAMRLATDPLEDVWTELPNPLEDA
jgi:siderophore synthetase component